MSEDAVQALVPHGEDAPPGARAEEVPFTDPEAPAVSSFFDHCRFEWDERADDLSPCAVAYVPAHYVRLDAGPHD